MDLHLQGLRALVTGASIGIGRAIALSLAAEGVELAIVGRRPNLLDEVAEACRQAGSPKVGTIEADMMAPDAPQTVTARAMETHGGIDILVNCMGASKTIGLDESEEDWEASMTLNWLRHRQVAKYVLPGMQQRRWGRILNVTGPSEVMGLNSAGVAKVAVHAWAKGVSDLVAKDGITVNCIGPGKIHSEQMTRLYAPEREKQFSEDLIPMGRFGEPEELADLVTFLASPRAGYITGTVIPVDGGFKRYMF
ncbi:MULTISPECIES: SDR family oxidoreductase [unclassified Chelatococcus]|uniref:SDR family NAD(P)-dependent oxidoreductase n=1 Tax=unclassified Chelatococcus TaxID=2638111 RepID=UPI001BD06D2F|nr:MULTISPECIES: SDR family oxidoreductase [unclassified Chelatococcus]MBS7701382.1 SDR family oxidoreductase [Chelatococcus sp. YT9]MBX3557462.1 SDR family oxidoreductase [Chelatococcus sp.]